MQPGLVELARDRRFIPFVYDYCDLWCAQCHLTTRCLLHVVEHLRPAWSGKGGAGNGDDGLAFARAVASASGPPPSPVADLDVRLADPSTAPRAPALGHPLELLARHYAIQADGFLHSTHATTLKSGAPSESPRAVISWFHLLIAAKTYRALVSSLHKPSLHALRDDASGAAKMAMIGIDRSIAALHQLEVEDDDVRIAALVELLEALRTGLEIRFPDARSFLRPGLDSPGGTEPS